MGRSIDDAGDFGGDHNFTHLEHIDAEELARPLPAESPSRKSSSWNLLSAVWLLLGAVLVFSGVLMPVPSVTGDGHLQL